MKIKHIVTLFALIAATLASVGCDQNKSGPVATPADTEETANPVDEPPLPRGTELFATAGPEGPVPTNTPTDVALNIKPSAGFKINKRYDWSFEFHPHDAVTLENPKIEGDALQLEDGQATIPVKVTAASAGEHTLKATGNFSVCNDDKCELYRDREVTFKMAATDG